MARGRKPNLVPTTQWSIMIPIDLAFQVENALMDPVTKRAKHAARSRLIQGLLYEWLKQQGINPLIPTDVMCPDCNRPKATSEGDIFNGACPRWYLPNNPDAAENCTRHSQPAGLTSATPQA